MKLFTKYLCIFSLLFFTEGSSSSPKKNYNIVLVVTDDQDSVLGGITPMRRTQDLIGKNGATFINSFVATPICCPSRSSILTGLYTHNHETVNNTVAGGCSSLKWQMFHEPKTFAAILQDNGYKTFYAGKYLNEYGKKVTGGPEHVPIGWDEWRGLVGNSKYYNFTLSHNGVPHVYNNSEYLTDVIKDMALDFIQQEVVNSAKPFLMFLAPPAPHSPFQPAARHEKAFSDIGAPRTPNFNIPAGKDKHWIMQMNPSPLPNSSLIKLDAVYRARWQTLLSVDEMVEDVVRKLEADNLLENTHIIVTSDNGYHIGQFSQPFDKRQPYETDIRVPLIIRGPDIAPGVILSHPVINIDLAPTILKMAGLDPPQDMNGVPIPFLSDSQSTNLSVMVEMNTVSSDDVFDRQMLIEYSGEGSSENANCPWRNDHNLYMCLPEFFCKCQDSKNNTYGCVRHVHPSIDFMYCAFSDTKETEEAYDLLEDPFQLTNIINGLMPAIKFKYQNTLQHLRECKGTECNGYHYRVY